MPKLLQRACDHALERRDGASGVGLRCLQAGGCTLDGTLDERLQQLLASWEVGVDGDARYASLAGNGGDGGRRSSFEQIFGRAEGRLDIALRHSAPMISGRFRQPSRRKR